MNLDTISYDGSLFIELRISCPSCARNGKSIPQALWVHIENNCGGRMFLGENGFLLCDANYRKEGECMGYAHISKWLFNCVVCKKPESEEGFSLNTNKAEAMKMGAVISMAGQLVEEAGIDWLASVINNLRNQEWNSSTKSKGNELEDNAS